MRVKLARNVHGHVREEQSIRGKEGGAGARSGGRKNRKWERGHKK